MSTPKPTILGLKKSFGFGDRLGLATPGHLRAADKYDFAGIYAQQSIREMTRTNRKPAEVMEAAIRSLEAAGYSQPWGADADHLKTEEDIQVTAAAGFTFFTIDPSEYVVNDADYMNADDLRANVKRLVDDRVFEEADWEKQYLGHEHDLGTGRPLKFDAETLSRAAVKYARAIHFSAQMFAWMQKINRGREFEVEVSVDETDSPTSPLEHLFFALELKRRGVEIVSLAPRFIGHFEKGIDYKGDLSEFEKKLVEHVAIAKLCGPYKISIHSGSDKFSAYPIIGKICGDLLHVKTAGTSYLEALRVIFRTDKKLFGEIACYAAGRFSEDRLSYHISTTEEEIDELSHAPANDIEKVYLDDRAGRQLMHVTFGSVLTKGKNAEGRPFKEAILENLHLHTDLHAELLDLHFTKHLSLLCKG